MKYLDIVELLVDKDEYRAKGVQKGMRGRITDCDIIEERGRFVFFVLEKARQSLCCYGVIYSRKQI